MIFCLIVGFPCQINMLEPKLLGNITLNGKKIQFTGSWNEMTISQYLRVLKMKDDTVELISILTGLEYDYLKKAKIQGIDKLIYAAQFINTPPKWDALKLTHIGPYKLPLNKDGIFDIQWESLAQFEDMRQIMTKLETGVVPLVESYAKYCAIYCQKLRDKEYDHSKAMQMVEEIYTYPAKHIVTAGSFFLIGLQALSSGTEASSRKPAKNRGKSTGRSSKKRSGHTPQSTGSRGKSR